MPKRADGYSSPSRLHARRRSVERYASRPCASRPCRRCRYDAGRLDRGDGGPRRSVDDRTHPAGRLFDGRICCPADRVSGAGTGPWPCVDRDIVPQQRPARAHAAGPDGLSRTQPQRGQPLPSSGASQRRTDCARSADEQPFRRRRLRSPVPAPPRRDTARLGEIQCPTLVVVAANDELRSVEESVALHEHIPQSTMTIVDRTGHLIPLERPARLMAALDAAFRHLANG